MGIEVRVGPDFDFYQPAKLFGHMTQLFLNLAEPRLTRNPSTEAVG